MASNEHEAAVAEVWLQPQQTLLRRPATAGEYFPHKFMNDELQGGSHETDNSPIEQITAMVACRRGRINHRISRCERPGLRCQGWH
jgi:hypothetical protein